MKFSIIRTFICFFLVVISEQVLAKGISPIKANYDNSWLSLVFGGSGSILVLAGVYYYMNGLFKGIVFSDEGILISYPNKTKTAGKLLSVAGISSIVIACL